MDTDLSSRSDAKIAVNGAAANTTGTVTPADDGYNVTVVFTDSYGYDWSGFADTNHIRLNAVGVNVSEPTFESISNSGFTMKFTISDVEQGATVEIDYEPTGFGS